MKALFLTLATAWVVIAFLKTRERENTPRFSESEEPNEQDYLGTDDYYNDGDN